MLALSILDNFLHASFVYVCHNIIHMYFSYSSEIVSFLHFDCFGFCDYHPALVNSPPFRIEYLIILASCKFAVRIQPTSPRLALFPKV